ncbi:MAG TPA: LLM class F420-dependent oxidoreductase [Dehalococcoidia bacterium]|nr:LLM class F420-dependent oxidoreductase [Dehalococcoidia bacterium]
MKYGVTLANRELGGGPDAIKDFVQAVEGAGFNHVLAAEHVAGGHPDRQKPGERVHTFEQPYHEPFVLFGFIAAVTRTLEMVTSILILPQRQTFVVAKQAAELDLLSGGRVRLGVGLGRNWMEYEVLNENFKNRGRRVEEQIEVLRKLWTEEMVTFEGKYHHIDRMGLNPNSIQKPIPIWMGTYTQVVEHAVERVARIADGWFPQFQPGPEFEALLERFRGYARAAGRDPASIGIECGLRIDPAAGPDKWAEQVEAFRKLGATHLRVGVAGEPSGMQQMIDTLTRFREAVD